MSVTPSMRGGGRLGGLDVMSHPVLNGAYYLGCEVLPMALVMYILRKLPPKVRDDGRRGGRVHVADGVDDDAGDAGDVERAGDTEDVESTGDAGGDHTLEQPLL